MNLPLYGIDDDLRGIQEASDAARERDLMVIDWEMLAVDIALGRRITIAEARDWIRIFLDSPPYGFNEFIETYKVKQ